MKLLLLLLAQWLRPDHETPRSARAPLDSYLKPLLIVAICLCVGPDLVALVEFTTLLEILGAGLFITACVAGFRILGAVVAERMRRLLVPGDSATFLRARVPSVVGLGVALVVRNGLLLLLPGILPSLLLYKALAPG